MPAGRIIYAFPGNRRILEGTAKPSGRRNILLSIYYLDAKDKQLIKDWWDASNLLFMDSGVHTLKAQMGITNIDRAYGKIQVPKGVKKKVEKLLNTYISFLSKNNDYWSYAFEMDVDEFLGVELTDKYYKKMCSVIPQNKIIRVWHNVSRVFFDWARWCQDPKQEYLAMEGGIKHNWNPEFYRPFIDEARRNNKKVHVLAGTSEKFLRDVDFDTGDSSSFRIGGRYSKVFIPSLGPILFGENSNDERHYSRLQPKDMQFTDDWLEGIGMDAETLLRDPDGEIRNVANLFYYDKYNDVPYEQKPVNRRLF